MKKTKIYKILCIVWPVIFLISAVLIILNAPVFCWDGIDNYGRMIGGCERDYGLALMLLIFPFLFWLIIEIPLLILYLRNKKTITP